MENSVYEAQKDLMLMYQKEDLIIREFEYLTTQAGLHVPVEKLMLELGERSGIEDIRMFSEILMTAKNPGEKTRRYTMIPKGITFMHLASIFFPAITVSISRFVSIFSLILSAVRFIILTRFPPVFFAGIFGSLVWKSSRDTDYDGVTYGLCRCLLVELQNYRYIGIERGRLDERQRRTYLGSSKKM